MSSIVRHQGSVIEPLDDRGFAALERRLKVIGSSTLCPKAFKEHPEDLLVVGIALHDLAVPVDLNTVNKCYVVGGRPEYMAQLQIMLGARGGWDITFEQHECDGTSATVYIGRRGTGERHAVTFTMADAERAKLPERNPNYKTYPDRMLLARAVTKAIGFYCPQVKLAFDAAADHAEQFSGQPVAEAADRGAAQPSGAAALGPAPSERTHTPGTTTAPPHDSPWEERFLAACRDQLGLDDDQVGAIVALATRGRTTKASAVEEAERAEVTNAFCMVRDGALTLTEVDGTWVPMAKSDDSPDRPF
jgi:hypothetical protein